MSKKSFISGAVVLMVSGLIVRLMGFVYRIYLSNLIGAEGIGLFQLISPIYSLIILTLTSGISISVSKMTAEQNAKGNYINIRRITRLSLIIVVTSGIIVSFLMLIFLNFIVNDIIKDSRTYYSFLLLIPCIPIVAASSTLKGYFYGLQETVPTAASQIVEQIVKITIIMLFASYFLDIGLEFACALATVGMALGEIASLIVLYIVYTVKKKKSEEISRKGYIPGLRIISSIIKISFPISVNRFTTSIMATIECILIPSRLLLSGLDYKACIEEFGRLSGMAMPLIYFPSLITSSLATTLVPAISEAISTDNMESVRHRISKSVQLSITLGILFTSVFLVFSNQIANVIYKNQNVGPILFSLAITCMFIYLQQTLLGVLNGLGMQTLCLRNSVIGYIIRITFIFFYVPTMGMNGYILGIIISNALVCVMNIIPVIKHTKMVVDIKNWIAKPAVSGIFILLTGKPIYALVTSFLPWKILSITITLVFLMVTAIMLLIYTGALDVKDIKRAIKI